MELRRIVLLVWHWLWLIVLSIVLAAGSAYIFSRNTIPVYSARTVLLISESKAVVMDTSVVPNTDRLAATYAETLKGRRVIEEVIARLALQETVEGLTGHVTVSAIRSTQLIELIVEDTNPERAAQIANEIPKVFSEQNYELQSRRFTASKASLQEQLDATQAHITDLQEQQSTLASLENPDQNVLDRVRRDLETYQSSYTTLAANLAEVQLEEAKQLDTLLVSEEATAPSKPIRPRTARNTLLAAVFGAIVALGVIYLIEYLDDMLHDPDEVKAALGLATLGMVPAMETSDADEELAMLDSGQSAVAEAYRVLRTNLQFAAVGRPLRLLQVTSSSPTEGKTMTSANLAIALAQSGQRVILVDCDLHRPRLHKILKLRNNVGLTMALLDDQTDLATLMQEGAVPGLHVLTSGPLPPNPAEVLGSARMREILATLVERADIVVLDSPPVLPVADTAVLASQADGVLLVMDASKTRRELAVRALLSLQHVQARVVGVVLNRLPQGRAGYRYYYYYYYNDYYGTDGSKKRKSHHRRWPWQRLRASKSTRAVTDGKTRPARTGNSQSSHGSD